MEIKSTDRDDFRRIYDENYHLIVQVIMHIVYNIEIAEDLTQEAFERFYLKNMTFPGEDDAKYWLIRVAKNLALNHVRRNKREIEMVEKVRHNPASSLESRDAAESAVEADERRAVRAAVDSLPENLRMVIQLKEYSGLDYKSIAKVLGISETNVKVRVYRARKKLEEALMTEDRDVY
ncbi:MAG: RNA polymerase sigma factor [Spirochaetes bacterium]|uniref:RNA polymerase sigma factor n=1 Tax=Candidatus Ornithospirochaeta stercoripullorum TaxID=2840899 RepID=A0A9D9E3H6_9SPIO|nr:RNA polymerase sigma factor [Candidatus Ornithospirochaeta stercoripullorum]